MSICLQSAIQLPQNTPKLSRSFLMLCRAKNLVTSGLHAIVSRQLVCGIKESLYQLGNGYAVQQGVDA